MTLQELLDTQYGADGDANLCQLLEGGADPNGIPSGQFEHPLHVAVRRRRARAVELLLRFGADVNVKNGWGKTAYAHAARRGFDDILAVLAPDGADQHLNDADCFAIAVSHGSFDQADTIRRAKPGVVRTGNPEEDRLLADLAGRTESGPVSYLIKAGANLAAPGLDGGTPLHQACWFGQPHNARLLIEAGAPLDIFDPTHDASPIGWVTHGSRHSGGAKDRVSAYVELARLLLDSGASLKYTEESNGGLYLRRLLAEASPEVADLLRRAAET